MERQNAAGRRLVVAIIVAILTTCILSIVVFIAFEGTGRLPQQIGRLFLTVALSYYLLQGANWARWISGILLGLSGAATLVLAAFALFLSLSLVTMILFVLGAVYLGSAFVLFFDPGVLSYFGAGRRRPTYTTAEPVRFDWMEDNGKSGK